MINFVILGFSEGLQFSPANFLDLAGALILIGYPLSQPRF